jgi:hypothetical protein
VLQSELGAWRPARTLLGGMDPPGAFLWQHQAIRFHSQELHLQHTYRISPFFFASSSFCVIMHMAHGAQSVGV